MCIESNSGSHRGFENCCGAESHRGWEVKGVPGLKAIADPEIATDLKVVANLTIIAVEKVVVYLKVMAHLTDGMASLSPAHPSLPAIQIPRDKGLKSRYFYPNEYSEV